jgi:subfamily B ATP-binding cassette protein MsbA
MVTLAIVPAVILVYRLASKRLRYTSREMQKNLGDITHVLEESVGAHKLVKVFDGMAYEQGRFGRAIQSARQFAMKQTVAANAHGPILQFLAALALAVIVYIATMQASSNETTVGGFVSYMVAMLMLSAPMKRLSSVLPRSVKKIPVRFGWREPRGKSVSSGSVWFTPASPSPRWRIST